MPAGIKIENSEDIVAEGNVITGTEEGIVANNVKRGAFRDNHHVAADAIPLDSKRWHTTWRGRSLLALSTAVAAGVILFFLKMN